MARDKSAHHEKIITAAREEFMTYGFTDASMRRIAAAAGMSVAGLYKHFTGKEEMFAALVEPTCQGLMDMYRQEEAEEQAALQTESLGDKWSHGGDAKMAMIFIYEHLDAFRLLICKSRGTRYESFLHDLSEAEEKITLDMMSLLREQGMPIRAIRCEKAKRLLDETDLSVSEIGASVGYVSSAHFSHLFKKMTGVAPSDWRRPETDQSKDLIDLTGLM